MDWFPAVVGWLVFTPAGHRTLVVIGVTWVVLAVVAVPGAWWYGGRGRDRRRIRR